MSISYAYLTQVKRQWENSNTEIATVTDSIMIDMARRATEVVDLLTLEEFAPYIETRYFDASGSHIDNTYRTIDLDQPMMSLTSATLADETSLVVDTDVRMIPRGRTPGLQLQLMLASTSNWGDYGANDWREGIAIVGEWGWRERYATEAWQLSGDAVKTDALTISVTTVKVTDADGTDWLNDTPRFDLGMMIKIDSEYMAITGVNTTDNELTVIRAIRGSTAATHEVAAPINVFVPQPVITRATQLIAAFNYTRRGETTRATFDGVRVVAGMEVPDEVGIILERFMVTEVSS